MKRRRLNRLLTLSLAVALLPSSLARAADDADLLKPEGGDKPAAAASQPARTLQAKVSPEARKALDDVKATYAGVTSLDLAGTISFDADIAGKAQKLDDAFIARFAAPNKFRHEVKGNMLAGSTGAKAYVLSLDDNAYVQKDAPKAKAVAGGKDGWPKAVWDVLTMQNPSLAMALSPDAATQLVDGATALALLNNHDLTADEVEKGTEVTQLPDAKVGDQSYTALKLTNPAAEFTFLFDPSTHLLRRVTVDEKSLLEKAGQTDVKKATLTFDYATVTPGAKAADDQFAWTPPASARELTATASARNAITGDEQANALVGKPAPDFKLTDLEGKEVALSEQKGSVVVVDFWATWCGPCVASLPHLNKVYEDRKAAGLKVFAVSVDQDKTKVKPFVEDKKLTVHVLFADDQQKVSESYGVTGIPQTVVIGKDGVVKKVFIGFGPGSEEGLAKAIDEAMK